jgi:hypothetical protein
MTHNIHTSKLWFLQFGSEHSKKSNTALCKRLRTLLKLTALLT